MSLSQSFDARASSSLLASVCLSVCLSVCCDVLRCLNSASISQPTMLPGSFNESIHQARSKAHSLRSEESDDVSQNEWRATGIFLALLTRWM